MGAAGKLCTLFSAPHYPMFDPTVHPPEYIPNMGAWVRLSPPHYHIDPLVVSFDASPRPIATPFL